MIKGCAVELENFYTRAIKLMSYGLEVHRVLHTLYIIIIKMGLFCKIKNDFKKCLRIGDFTFRLPMAIKIYKVESNPFNTHLTAMFLYEWYPSNKT